jgi:hypothetical protein
MASIAAATAATRAASGAAWPVKQAAQAAPRRSSRASAPAGGVPMAAALLARCSATWLLRCRAASGRAAARLRHTRAAATCRLASCAVAWSVTKGRVRHRAVPAGQITNRMGPSWRGPPARALPGSLAASCYAALRSPAVRGPSADTSARRRGAHTRTRLKGAVRGSAMLLHAQRPQAPPAPGLLRVRTCAAPAARWRACAAASANAGYTHATSEWEWRGHRIVYAACGTGAAARCQRRNRATLTGARLQQARRACWSTASAPAAASFER